MVTAVILISVLNLSVGCAVALLADSPWSLVLPSLPRRRGTAEPAAGESDQRPSEADDGDLPGEWRSRLADHQIVAESEIEALLWMVYLDALAARETLLSSGPVTSEEFHRAAKDWVGSLEDWAGACERHKSDTELGSFAAQFEELLLDHQFQAQSVVDGLQADSGPRALPALFDALNKVRDSTAAALGAILRGPRIESVAEQWRIDEPTGALSRLGMEVLFHQWRRDDQEGVRMASCVLIDVDRTAKISESFGVAAADSVVIAFGRLLRDLVRKDRGFDRVVRYRGDTYLLFFGDTAASSAANGAERIRQTVEASSFVLNDNAVDLSATFAIAEVLRDEPLAGLLDRLERVVAEAKAAGRNRTFVDSGGGPKAVSLPQYEVERREIVCE